MPTISKLQSAYLAGLIDGEGYIGLMDVRAGNKKEWFSSHESMFVPVLKVAMCDKPMIYWLFSSFGGTFETRKAHGNARESYCWSLKKRKAIDFVRYIYPFLRVKNKQAELLLRFPSGKPGCPLTEEIYEKRKSLCVEIKELNKRGSLRD